MDKNLFRRGEGDYIVKKKRLRI